MFIVYFFPLTQIPAARQFGVFMGLVILLCYVQVFLLLPSFLYFWAKWLSRVEKCCTIPFLWVGRRIVQKCKRLRVLHNQGLSIRSTENPRLDTFDVGVSMNDVESDDDDTGTESDGIGDGDCDSKPLLQTTLSNGAQINGHLVNNSPDDDSKVDHTQINHTQIDLTQFDKPGENGLLNGGSVIHVPSKDPPNGHSLSESPTDKTTADEESQGGDDPLSRVQPASKHTSASSMSLLTLKALYHFIAYPAVSLRVVLLILFCVFLVAGAVCAGFLKASGDLQLFSKDTNLQRILDLTGNVTTVMDYDCSQCSAYYKHKFGTYVRK